MTTDKLLVAIDMDQIMCQFIKMWISKYSKITGEEIKEQDVICYELRNLVSKPNVLDKILSLKGTFFDPEPIPGMIKYFNKILELGHDVIVLTQPPRASEYGVRDKRRWLRKYLPEFNLEDVIFTHRKELIKMDILFDDSPAHLIAWAKNNPDKITAKIEYAYNKDIPTTWTFKNKQTAWKEFYGKIKKL